MTAIVETNGIGKRYGDVVAVEQLSLRVDPGEIYAFLGLNGGRKDNHYPHVAGNDQADLGHGPTCWAHRCGPAAASPGR